MGVSAHVGYEKFPRQGKHLGLACKVLFEYRGEGVWGTVVRDDLDEPFIMIIRLVDGRHVLATECQYSIPNRRSDV